MFARYINFVDTAANAAFLWSRQRGIVRANASARTWTDILQADSVAAAASECADSRKARLYLAPGVSFLLVPLIDTRERADYVIGVSRAQLADVPLLLHDLHENLRDFSQTIHLLPQAVLTARPNGAFDFASRRWYEMTGVAPEELDVGKSLRVAAGPHAPNFERNWASGIAGGELFSFEILLRTTRGTRWFDVRAAPSYEGSHLRKWVVTLDDVHERIEARNEVTRTRARFAALAEIGAIALDYKITDDRLVERALGCAASALDGIWYVTFTIDGRRHAYVWPPSATIPAEAFDVPEELSGVVAATAPWFGEDRRPVLRAPLDFGEPGVHQIAVAGAAGARAFDELDVAFIRDVSWRIASALRNSTAYRRESRIARVLQTAMLPVALPHAPGISFDVSYTAAETEALIGGDWYDAFQLHDGRLAFSIGDVAGHGLDAAVVMGHVRENVRTRSLRGATPSEVLDETNGVVLAGGYGLITAIVGFLDPSTLLVEYACAGHAPPLRVDASGTVDQLELGDVILGAVPRAKFRTQSLRLRGDCALVLYTDGLVEFARDARAAEARLRGVLSAWAREGFRAKAGELVERVLQSSVANDDAAMLIARVQRTTARGYVSERRTPARSAADSRS